MYHLFLNQSERANSVVRYPEFDYIKRTYERELADVEDYYHNRVYAVRSNHFLANILRHISVPLHYPIGQFVNVAAARTPFIANHFKMTSSLNRGQLFDGIFYGAGSTEIILSTDEYFNPFEAEINWVNLRPVKVLLHPKSDLGLLLPNGKVSGSGTGLSVISVNIPMLALQYRCFTTSQHARRKETSGGLDVAHFLHMYVLPNMVAQQTDIALLNRLMNLYYGAPNGTAYIKHSFPIVDYGYKVDNVFSKLIVTIKQKNLRYEWLMKMIPAIHSEDMQEALQMPDFSPTRQVQWALIMARLKIMKFVIDIGGQRSLTQNRLEINLLQRTLKRLMNDSVLESALTPDIMYDYSRIIEEIMEL